MAGTRTILMKAAESDLGGSLRAMSPASFIESCSNRQDPESLLFEIGVGIGYSFGICPAITWFVLTVRPNGADH